MVRNDIETTINNFLSGKALSEEVIRYVISAMFRHEESIDIDYTKMLEMAKTELTLAERRMTSDVIYINTKEPVSDDIQVGMIRYLNVCKEGKFIVVINDEIKYIPMEIRKFGLDDIQQHVEKQKAPYIKILPSYSLEKHLFRNIITH